jgi:hypothetical protein
VAFSLTLALRLDLCFDNFLAAMGQYVEPECAFLFVDFKQSILATEVRGRKTEMRQRASLENTVRCQLRLLARRVSVLSRHKIFVLQKKVPKLVSAEIGLREEELDRENSSHMATSGIHRQQLRVHNNKIAI